MAGFTELNNDQRRESINARQRFEAWQEAIANERHYRGSLVWSQTKGSDYLLKSYYDEQGHRRQTSLGRRSPATEEIKQRFDAERARAGEARQQVEAALARQAAINRALGLGRIPLTPARVMRALDRRGLMGTSLRIAGTNAIYAYEAACGVFVDAAVTATNDIDLLLDSRSSLRLIADAEFDGANLLQIIQSADRSFIRSNSPYRARNNEGYLVDLIVPVRNPPWTTAPRQPEDREDLEAAEIEGLIWLENAPPFRQMAIDERGAPLWIVAPDPRVFAVHKHWLSTRPDRERLKARRDHAQAASVAELVRTFLPHLPFDARELQVLPKKVVGNFLAEFPDDR